MSIVPKYLTGCVLDLVVTLCYVLLVEVSWELLVHNVPPFAIVVLGDVWVVLHEVSDVGDPRDSLVGALTS